MVVLPLLPEGRLRSNDFLSFENRNILLETKKAKHLIQSHKERTQIELSC